MSSNFINRILRSEALVYNCFVVVVVVVFVFLSCVVLLCVFCLLFFFFQDKVIDIGFS